MLNYLRRLVVATDRPCRVALSLNRLSDFLLTESINTPFLDQSRRYALINGGITVPQIDLLDRIGQHTLEGTDVLDPLLHSLLPVARIENAFVSHHTSDFGLQFASLSLVEDSHLLLLLVHLPEVKLFVLALRNIKNRSQMSDCFH